MVDIIKPDKIAAIITARIFSSRLLAKIFLELPPRSGTTVLERVLDAVCDAKTIDLICVTTPDVAIALMLHFHFIFLKGKLTVWLWRGDRNPLTEFYKAAEHTKCNTIVRITADCPLLRTNFIDETVKFYLDNDFDYVYNDCDGSDVEVFNFDILKKAYEKVTEPYDIEHITPWIRKNGRTAIHPTKAENMLSLNTQEDYEKICKIWSEKEKRNG